MSREAGYKRLNKQKLREQRPDAFIRNLLKEELERCSGSYRQAVGFLVIKDLDIYLMSCNIMNSAGPQAHTIDAQILINGMLTGKRRVHYLFMSHSDILVHGCIS